MRFLGSKFTQNALAAGAPPRTPLGSKRSPDPLPISEGRFATGERERRGKREEAKGKGVLGREREREGKGRGEGGKAGKEIDQGREGRGSLRHWR